MVPSYPITQCLMTVLTCQEKVNLDSQRLFDRITSLECNIKNAPLDDAQPVNMSYRSS